MQRGHVRSMVRQEGFTLSERVQLGVLPQHGYLKEQKTSEITGDGTLTLDAGGLHFEGRKNGEPYSFFIPIKKLPTYGMCVRTSPGSTPSWTANSPSSIPSGTARSSG